MQSTLNEADTILCIEDLPTWNTTDIPQYNTSGQTETTAPQFPCDPEINDKLILWSGLLSKLRTNVIVDVFNEQFNQWIISKSGSQLAEEMAQERKQCRTSDARLFACSNVPCRFVIRVVTPRFNEKYVSAAESALYNCYRNTLLLAIEHNLTTVVLEPLHLINRGFPSELGAHIALRTVRRILEKHKQKLERVMFHLSSEDYLEVYTKLAPIYFPRNRSEEIHSIRNCPADIGNENGEPVHPDREIRISAYPRRHPLATHSSSSSLGSEVEDAPPLSSRYSSRSQGALAGALEVGTDALKIERRRSPTQDISLLAPGSHSFARMETDPDTRRRQSAIVGGSSASRTDPQARRRSTGVTNSGEPFQRERRYQRLLRQAMQTQRAREMSNVASLRVLYQCGTDVDGRCIVLVVGRSLDWSVITETNALYYFISYMDRIVNNPYVVVYLQTMANSSNQPSSELIRRIYENTDDRYRVNLRGLYLLHTSLWNRLVTWFLSTFTGPAIKPHIHQVLNISQLYRLINPRQLDLPEFVYEYDRKLYGFSPSNQKPSKMPTTSTGDQNAAL